MSISFLDHIKDVEDPRIPGMIVYPLDEILLTVLIGLLCRAEDFDEIEALSTELLDWMRDFLPFKKGVAPAQTLRRTLSRLDPQRLEQAFCSWTASLAKRVKGVVAVDGKTLRGSKQEASGKGALHLISAFAHESGLILAQRAVDSKSNEISAIPELLDMLALDGAIVTLDAMGTQKQIARKIISKEADYVLAVKGNQGRLEEEIALFFDDPIASAQCACHEETTGGHGRIEQRTIRAADAAWLAERHPQWVGLKSILSVTTRRTIKKTGKTSTETRLYITSLPPDPVQLAKVVRAHWSIENNLHWTLDVTFREDECRVRKDHAPRNLAMIRRTVLNMLRREPSKISLKRKRLKAAMNQEFRSAVIVC